jgi:glycosyltransferase involved in cell wall biosynthesis
MGKIKVLELIDGGFLGGGQTNILSILRNIDRTKFNVSAAAKGGGNFEREVLETKAPFYPLTLPKVLRHKYLTNLQKLYNKEHFDIVHSHGGIGGFYGRLLKKHNPKIRSVHTIHGIHYLNKNNFLVRGASKTIEQYLVQFSDKIICVSNSDYTTAISNRIASQNNTVVILNGIDVSKYTNNGKELSLLKELGLTKDNFIVGNVSRFDIQKNQKLIIQASYYLIKKFPEMRFVMVGDGKLLNQMKQYAKESNLDKVIIFTGEKENLRSYYSLFDIFVLPSFWEGMPYALLEAMASKIPVICSNIPNHLEVVKNNYSALTVNPYIMEDLFHKITQLYQNEELRCNLILNAYNEVQNYDEKDMTAKIVDVYTEVMGV